MSVVLAHPGHDHEDDAPTQEAASDAPKPSVRITSRDGFRFIVSNGIPDHPTGRFPNRGNPNRIREQDYEFRVPLTPEPAERAVPADRYLFGVAVNGIVFDPGTAEFWNNDRRWRYEALSGKINLGIDESNAHVQPTGAYHYHGIPHALLKQLKGERRMTLIGFAADGFPIYGPMALSDPKDPDSQLRKMQSSYRLRQGTRPRGEAGPGGEYDGTFTADYEYVADAGDLDEYNGRFGITPEYPEGTYHYILTDTYPFIPRLLRGTPDPSFERPRGGGPPPPRRS